MCDGFIVGQFSNAFFNSYGMHELHQLGVSAASASQSIVYYVAA